MTLQNGSLPAIAATWIFGTQATKCQLRAFHQKYWWWVRASRYWSVIRNQPYPRQPSLKKSHASKTGYSSNTSPEITEENQNTPYSDKLRPSTVPSRGDEQLGVVWLFIVAFRPAKAGMDTLFAGRKVMLISGTMLCRFQS